VAQISPEIMMQLSPATTGHALSSPSFCVAAMVNLGVGQLGSANNPKGMTKVATA
jgi:hypothetical protein